MENNANLPESEEITRLRQENHRLKELLKNHGISEDQAVAELAPVYKGVHEVQKPDSIHKPSSDEKIDLFRSLFRGREDVYPLRWESKKGSSGYSPACGNEWKPDICEKPRTKCADCRQRQLLPVTPGVIYDHLTGKHTVGVYPLLPDDSCLFLACDFDDDEWKDDSLGFIRSWRDFNVPAALEISRSGNGAHVWIFFESKVPARDARQLGAALISHTCSQTRQLTLSSYDRFFPNQDSLPKGGFGNLIALPLQKKPREQNRSVFVDDRFSPWPDQWDFLSKIRPMKAENLKDAIRNASGDRHPLDVAFVEDEDYKTPWKSTRKPSDILAGPLPKTVTLVLANQIFITKDELPQSLLNRIIRLAAFQNPEFYKAQALRLSVWDKPRIIGCAENYPRHISIPRGCLEAVKELLKKNAVEVLIQDERLNGDIVETVFTGRLRADQSEAVTALLKADTGVFCAPTAFGKTVVAASIIAHRKISTLILVHRTDLLRQWQERLRTFLDLAKEKLGVIGGGKKKPSGMIDIAVIQSLSRRDDLSDLLDRYGQIIIDECHHLSAVSFALVLKQSKARFILGLTATPIRRDGHHPIIFMQCGPIRHMIRRVDDSRFPMEVRSVQLPSPSIPSEAGIQDIFRILSNDDRRNQQIGNDIKEVYNEGRKVLVLTERTEHIEILRRLITTEIPTCLVLHGRMKKKERKTTIETLAQLPDDAPRVLLATGKLVGEGFDHPILDTLILAMPISWKGTLQQYAGRLHRDHCLKTDIRIYDYVEKDCIQHARMWEKRRKGYLAMGYQIREEQFE